MSLSTKRLGRGLGSLIAAGGDAQKTPTVPREVDSGNSFVTSVEQPNFQKTEISKTSLQIQEISLEDVIPNPHQPRKVIDPQAVGELASSIASEGLLQPIVVRPTESGYELIAGERRWRAHQHLGKAKILARVLDASDLSSASLSLIENLQREELNPIEEAMGYQSLVSDFNLTQQQVAARMGKSRSHVTNVLRLLNLDSELRRLLAEGELSLGHAKVLLGIDDPDKRVKFGQRAVLEGWTVRQCEDFISGNSNLLSRSIRSKVIASSQYSKLLDNLRQQTGRKVKIKSLVSGGGMISFSFKDENDLEAFVAKLGSI